MALHSSILTSVCHSNSLSAHSVKRASAFWKLPHCPNISMWPQSIAFFLAVSHSYLRSTCGLKRFDTVKSCRWVSTTCRDILAPCRPTYTVFIYIYIYIYIYILPPCTYTLSMYTSCLHVHILSACTRPAFVYIHCLLYTSCLHVHILSTCTYTVSIYIYCLHVLMLSPYTYIVSMYLCCLHVHILSPNIRPAVTCIYCLHVHIVSVCTHTVFIY